MTNRQLEELEEWINWASNVIEGPGDDAVVMGGRMVALVSKLICDRTMAGLEELDALKMCGLGLSGELGEYVEGPGPVELGDVHWYVSGLANTLGIPRPSADVSPAPRVDAGPQFFATSSGRTAAVFALLDAAAIGEVVKKIVYHGLDKQEAIDRIGPRLQNLCQYLHATGHFWGWQTHAVWAWNIGKLSARYPGGFEKLLGGSE